MKIGINATFLNEKPTGAAIYTREVSRILAERHKDILFFSPVAYDDIPLEYSCKTPDALKGSPDLSNSLYRAVYINTVLPVMCKLKNIDILYCPILEFPFIPLIPSVVHIHDLHFIHFSAQFGLAALRMKLSLKLVNNTVRRVIVSSEFVKRELIKTAVIEESRIDLIPLAYNSAMFRPMPMEMRKKILHKYNIKGNYILFVGSLFPYKNLKTLMAAFLKIKHQIPQFLVVAGRREFSADPLISDERILYMDYVPAEDLPFLYSYADMFVYPSLMEGFGIPPLEAMACGTPVISSNAGSLPEVVGNAGMLFDPMDADYLSRLIEEVADNEAHRKELAERGLENVKRFSWDKTAEGILRSCEKAIRKAK